MGRKRISNIEKIHLIGLPVYIDLYRIMCVDAKRAEIEGLTVKDVLRNVALFFVRSVYEKYCFHFATSKSNKILLFYGRFWYRNDHQSTFINFESCFDTVDAMYAEPISKMEIHPLRGIACFFIAFVWILQLIFHRVPLKFSLYSLPYVQMCFLMKKQIKKINVEQYSLLTVYSELTPDDNYMVQLFEWYGIQTATMQHGIFVCQEPNSDNVLDGIQLRESKVKYFLAWNKMTYDMAIKIGMKPEKIKVLGIPRYVNLKKPTESLYSKGKVFGVLLNGYTKDFHLQNIKLIEMANQISAVCKLQYVVRYHPTMSGNEYDKYCSEDCVGVCDNNSSILEYAQTVCFTILTCSTAFIELVYLRHPVYRLANCVGDIYSTIPFNQFETVDDLKVKQQSELDDRLFSYLCNDYEVKANYESFFGLFS